MLKVLYLFSSGDLLMIEPNSYLDLLKLDYTSCNLVVFGSS